MSSSDHVTVPDLFSLTRDKPALSDTFANESGRASLGAKTTLPSLSFGSDAPQFRYRYASSDEFGPIATILLYKTEAGNANPTRRREPSWAMELSGLLGRSWTGATTSGSWIPPIRWWRV